jgi:phosphotriesterase-related protein
VLRLAEVSRRSGVAVVAPTGLHLSKYYPAGERGGHWGAKFPAERLAEVFIAEIEQGIDVNDLAGPEVQRSPHRAGVIKVAGGHDRLGELEQRVFRAAAIAHRRTGCPILTHTEEGTAALEQAELLSSNGVDLSHVVLSHLDRNPDLAYHRRVLRTGVNIEYDSSFRWKNRPDNPTWDLLCALLPEFPDQIVLGMDAARRSYWSRLGGSPGMGYLRREFVPRLAAALGEDLVHRLTVSTPARAYCFTERKHP